MSEPALEPALKDRKSRIVAALRRFRFGILAVFLSASLLAILRFPPEQPAPLALAALGGFAVTWIGLRHIGLALAVMLAPLPGILWNEPSAYALGLAFGLMMAAGFWEATLRGGIGYLALWRPVRAMIWVVIFTLFWSLNTGVLTPSLVAASLSTALLLPALLTLFSFDENFIARANRQREILFRGFSWLSHLGQPRWALSLMGVMLVCAVLRLFQLAPVPSLSDMAAAGLVGAIILVSTRDSGSAIAGFLSAALLIAYVHGVTGAALLFLLFVLTLARSRMVYDRAGEMPDMAWARSIEDNAAMLVMAALAAVIATVMRGGPDAGLHVLLALVGALVFFPALAGALNYLFPHRIDMERRYRV